jgi:hypothetical protein
MRKAITLVAILALLSPYANAEEKSEEKKEKTKVEETTKVETSGWLEILAGYNVSKNSSAIRFHGGFNIKDFGSYGMIDLLPEGDDSADIDGLYSEIRAWYDFMDNLGIMLDYQGGTGFKDLVRAGLFIHGEKGILSGQARLMGVDTSMEHEQISLYGVLQLPADLSMDLLVEYNFDYEGESNSIYTELGFYINIIGGLSIGSHTRALFDFEEKMYDLQEIGLLKYEF